MTGCGPAVTQALMPDGGEIQRLAAAALTAPLPFDRASFDCVVVGDMAPAGSLELLAPLVRRFGALYVVPNPEAPLGDDLDETLDALGMRVYVSWEQKAPDGDPAASVPGIVMAVRKTYDPVRHARTLFKAKHPDWSYEVLTNVPESFLGSQEDMARIASEKQLCLLAWERSSEPAGRLNRFALEQREFYRAVTFLPHFHQAYLCHAQFYRLLGRNDMAARLLRSIEHVAPDRVVQQQLELIPSSELVEPPEQTVPEWSGTFRPRILMVSHRHSDFGLDTLYDGLHTVLGPTHVNDFPWKPTLHGGEPEIAKGYPCTFDHPGEAHDLDWMCAKLREGYFDCVFYTDTLKQLEQELVHPLMEAAAGVPLFLLDTWDDCGDYAHATLDHMGCKSACAYFKREMLVGGEYVPRTFPMPFSYADGRVPADVSGDRPEALFWAGKRQDGLRRLYLDHIEEAFGLRLDAQYSQKEYVQAMARARIGLNIFGLGFDTVRYWELPAHGCMLLSERLPIHVPYNFRDGESAVFFDDAADLDEKLAYYLSHPDEASAIAAAGHEHFKRYHTASARARQLLGRVEHLLNGKGFGA